MSKTCCQERRCDWVGDTSEMLSAPHPFIEGDLITACPKCKTLESSLWDACDAEGCTRAASGGYPMPNGSYARRCHDHAPRRP